LKRRLALGQELFAVDALGQPRDVELRHADARAVLSQVLTTSMTAATSAAASAGGRPNASHCDMRCRGSIPGHGRQMQPARPQCAIQLHYLNEMREVREAPDAGTFEASRASFKADRMRGV
jgi:hypothetical protein